LPNKKNAAHVKQNIKSAYDKVMHPPGPRTIQFSDGGKPSQIRFSTWNPKSLGKGLKDMSLSDSDTELSKPKPDRVKRKQAQREENSKKRVEKEKLRKETQARWQKTELEMFGFQKE
jgi:hypothetical protein